METTFGWAIIKAQIERKIRGIIITEEVPKITHQQFAEDTILPRESTLKEGQKFKQIINNYMEATSQKINNNKLDVLFINTKEEVEREISIIMKFKKGTFPCKNIGIQLEKGIRENKA